MKNRVREYRERAGMSQAELARKLKISYSHLNKVEKGNERLTFMMAARIAKILNCKIDDIFLP